MAGYLGTLLGKNIDSAQKNVDAIGQSIKHVHDGADMLREISHQNYAAKLRNPKTWANVSKRYLADLKIKNKETGLADKLTEQLNKAQNNLSNEQLKTFGTRAGTGAAVIGATAGGLYLKKKMDEQKQREAANQAYYESLNKAASEILGTLAH